MPMGTKRKVWPYKKRRTKIHRKIGRGLVNMPRGVYKFKLRIAVPLITDVVGDFKMFFNTHNLTTLGTINPGGADAVQLGDYSEAGNVIQLFDQYKVNSINYKYIPTLSNPTQDGEGSNGMKVISNLANVQDVDNVGYIPSYQAMIQYDTFKAYDPTKGWSQTFKVPKSIQGNTGSQSLVLPGGWLNCQASSDHVAGTITTFGAQSFSLQTGAPLAKYQLGYLIVTANVDFKYRQ